MNTKYKYNEYIIQNSTAKFIDEFINKNLRYRLCYINNISGICKGVDDENNLIVSTTLVDKFNQVYTDNIKITTNDINNDTIVRCVDLANMKTTEYKKTDIIITSKKFNVPIFDNIKQVNFCLMDEVVTANLISITDTVMEVTIITKQMFDFKDMVYDMDKIEMNYSNNNYKLVNITIHPEQLLPDVVIAVFTQENIDDMDYFKYVKKYGSIDTTENDYNTTTSDVVEENSVLDKVVDDTSAIVENVDNNVENERIPLIVHDTIFRFKVHKFQTNSIYSIETKDKLVKGYLTKITNTELTFTSNEYGRFINVVVKPEDVSKVDIVCRLFNGNSMTEFYFWDIVATETIYKFNPDISAGTFILSDDNNSVADVAITNVKDDYINFMVYPHSLYLVRNILSPNELLRNKDIIANATTDVIYATINIDKVDKVNNLYVTPQPPIKSNVTDSDADTKLKDNTFSFDVAIKYLLEGKAICNADWVDETAFYELDKDTNEVCNSWGNTVSVLTKLINSSWKLFEKY